MRHLFLRTVVSAAVASSLWSGSGVDRPVFARQDQRAEQDEDRSVRRFGDVVSSGQQEFSIDIPAVEAPPAASRPEVMVPDAERNARLQALLDRRFVEGDLPEIGQALDALLIEIRDAGRAAIVAGDLDLARARNEALRVLRPESAIGSEIDAAVERRARIDELEQRIGDALADQRLLEPADDSAIAFLARLRSVSEPDSEGPAERLQDALRARFQQFLADQRLEQAGAWIEEVGASELIDVDLDNWREQLDALMLARIEDLLDVARAALRRGDAAAAGDAVDALGDLGAEGGELASMRTELERLRRYADFEPGQRFRDRLGDAETGPEMIVVPTGSMRLGSLPGEPGRFDDEGPVFMVEFDRGFALSATEITVGAFRRFIDASGYRTDAERAGISSAFDERTGGIAGQRFVDWRRDYQGDPAPDNLPVVHVSFNDAQAYADWLSAQTGERYRLPSEAEFEYALRAGTATRFWWGDESPDEPLENLAGDGDRFGQGQRWSDAFADYRDGFWGPAPVASFAPNPLGFHDLGGNVLEWTADCWIDEFRDPPTDGRARIRDRCNRRTLRGGAWTNGPATSRSAYRLSGSAEFSDARVGFRVARDLVEVDDSGSAGR